MTTHVTLECVERIGYLTFTPEIPYKPPTLDYAVLDELEQHCKIIHTADQPLDAVVVQSGSPKYFVVGANLQALQKIDHVSIVEWVKRGHEVFNQLEDLPLPVIAKITGYVLGGGLELALACDFILCSEQAQFGLPETGLGFIPGWGGSRRLPLRVGEARAKELIFTGKIIPAAEAYRIGLVNFVGTDADLDIYLTTTLHDIRKNSRLANSLVKNMLKHSLTADRQSNCDEESRVSQTCLASGDTQERLKAFFQKRGKAS